MFWLSWEPSVARLKFDVIVQCFQCASIDKGSQASQVDIRLQSISERRRR